MDISNDPCTTREKKRKNSVYNRHLGYVGREGGGGVRKIRLGKGKEERRGKGMAMD